MREVCVMSEGTGSKPRAWLPLLLSVVAIIALGFAVYVLLVSWRVGRSEDARRVRDLAIAASNLNTWPATADQIGRANLYHRDVNNGGHADSTDPAGATIRLYHPDLATFDLRYSVPTAGAACTKDVAVLDNGMTVQGEALSPAVVPDLAYRTRLRAAAWFRPAGGAAKPICFTIAKLDLAAVTAVPRGFQHLLLARVPGGKAGAGTGEVAAGGDWRNAPIAAQIGDHRLPIRTLAELPKLQSQFLAVAYALGQAAGQSKAVPLPPAGARDLPGDTLQPFDSNVAGTRYRFYVYPVTLKGNEYMLVGTVRDGGGAALGRLGSRALAFAIALLLLAALTPTMKLAMLGPVDGIRPMEVGALVFGLLAAVAFATAALVATADIVQARGAAYQRLQESAGAIRTRTVREIHRVLLDRDRSAIDELSSWMPPQTVPAKMRSDMLIKRAATGPEDDPRDFRQPDSLFPVARSGLQADNMVLAVARDLSGAGIEVGNRSYFRRAVDAEFAPDTQRLVAEVRRLRFEGLWGCATGGMIFDQVRSRPDGVSKTIVSTQVDGTCVLPVEPDVDLDEQRGRLHVIGLSFVLKSLLAPTLHESEEFAVLDASPHASGLPVLFHSERGRAEVERFAEALGGRARRGFASAAARTVACDMAAKPSAIDTFSGEYEGVPTLFAAARMPCTDWIVTTFVSRDLIDARAVRPAVHAIVVWAWMLAGLIALFFVVNLVKRRIHDRPAWLWLWPDPARRERYGRVRIALALVALVTLLLLAVGAPVVAAFFGPVLAGVALYAVILGRDHVPRIRSVLSRRSPLAASDAPGAGSRPVLDRATERYFGQSVALMVLCLCTLPIVALAIDARGYFGARQVGDDHAVLHRIADQERHAVEAVALTYRKAARAAPAALRSHAMPSCPARSDGIDSFGLIGLVGESPCFNGGALNQEPTGLSLAAAMRRGVLHWDANNLYGTPARVASYWSSGMGWVVFVAIALVLAGLLLVAFKSALRGLFGFGVVLEAVPYPELPLRQTGEAGLRGADIDIAALPPRFIAVAPPAYIRQRLERHADRTLDLYDETLSDKDGWSDLLVRPHPPRLLVLRNLELLMRSRDRRLKVLAMLERLVRHQGHDDGDRDVRIGLVTDLSPLDRLLHAYERDAEELERLSPEDRHAQRVQLAGEREEMRWSRLFEGFTTYTYRATPRTRVDLTTIPPDERVAVRTVENEVKYLPDHTIAAVIPDEEPPLEPHEIAQWAGSLKHAAPRAIVDYLSSMLIEHYQLVWTVSSHAERLLLHRYAHRQLVNVGKAYALRSLVRRGLVVLDPSPRIMNRSFAQFIRHAEEPKTLARWRGDERSAWQKVQFPLIVALPFAFGVLALTAIRSGVSLAALVPLAISVGPALLHLFSSGRRA